MAENLSYCQQDRIEKESTAKNDIVNWVVEEAFVKEKYKHANHVRIYKEGFERLHMHY